jgi:ribosomal-protein-alanine N-acetyltransferase
LIGCVNLNEIVRGHFQSACKGYYVFSPFHAQHLMKRVMTMVISNAFGDFELHRLEAKIQAANTRSIGLMHSPEFRYEGLSQRYIKINNAWQDHERYAITSEEWNSKT